MNQDTVLINFGAIQEDPNASGRYEHAVIPEHARRHRAVALEAT